MKSISTYGRYCTITAALIASVFTANAQKRQYSLKGFMGVQGGESFTYKLELKDSTGNILSGYGYTFLNEKNDVKAYVVGILDRDGKTLAIREISILHNNYFASKATICLVEAVLTFDNKEKVLAGPLITKTAGNGADCSKGSISFSTVQELDNLFVPAAALTETPVAAKAPVAGIHPKRAPKVVYDTLPKSKPVVVPAVKQPDNITEGKDKTYSWHSDQILLEVWDGNNEDNDKITILFNGNEILQNYTLTKEKKKLSLPVGGNELNIITIIANNEGNDPPNTANILLTDNETRYDVVAHNNAGKQAIIKIRKKP
jgi:hypothetical protein